MHRFRYRHQLPEPVNLQPCRLTYLSLRVLCLHSSSLRLLLPSMPHHRLLRIHPGLWHLKAYSRCHQSNSILQCHLYCHRSTATVTLGKCHYPPATTSLLNSAATDRRVQSLLCPSSWLQSLQMRLASFLSSYSSLLFFEYFVFLIILLSHKRIMV